MIAAEDLNTYLKTTGTQKKLKLTWCMQTIPMIDYPGAMLLAKLNCSLNLPCRAFPFPLNLRFICVAHLSFDSSRPKLFP